MLSGVVGKVVVSGLSGLVGAALMAAVDVPKTRGDLFTRAIVAFVGSAIFGPFAVHAAAHYLPFVQAADLETAVPVYFLVGALSWGLLGFLRSIAQILRGDGAVRWINRKLGD